MLECWDGLNTTDAIKASLNKHRDCLDKSITRFFTRIRKDSTSAAYLVERPTMWDNITHANVRLKRGLVRISEHRDRPFRLIVTAHFANA